MDVTTQAWIVGGGQVLAVLLCLVGVGFIFFARGREPGLAKTGKALAISGVLLFVLTILGAVAIDFAKLLL